MATLLHTKSDLSAFAREHEQCDPHWTTSAGPNGTIVVVLDRTCDAETD